MARVFFIDFTAGVSVFAVAQGLSYPLLSFILIEKGISPTLIGLSAAMTPLGLISSAPFTAHCRVHRSNGTRPSCRQRSHRVADRDRSLSRRLGLFPLRFLLGAAINPLFILSEAWMILLVAPTRRGRAMGIYAAILSAGYAAGPLILALTGEKGFARSL